MRLIRPKSWMGPETTYQLGDNLPYGHPAKKEVKGMQIWKSIDFAPTPSNGVCVRAVWSGEYRAPKKGEWYLSGCEGFERAYLAPNDLSTKYFIMKIAVVKFKTIQKQTIKEVY
jgi:hypothetical protein